MYNPKTTEPKWQKTWQDAKVFRTNNPVTDADFQVPKYYALDMFPYPSGAGLHVGHPKGFIATDIISRYKHAKGFRVLHPMGWDSFGLPAENYAIKTGVHPKITTDENIANFKRQLKALGLSYDWDREVATTDPKYYKWTQWIFLKLFEAGLAYEQDLPINYCPSCKTGLANEEVVGDNICDRCSTKVERRKIRQWVLAITKYAERLLADVDSLDWPEGIKEMQRNWIGKSEGVEFEMKKALSPLEKGGQGGLDTKPPLALILHGWEDEKGINRHWQPWLKSNLEILGYEVVMPDLPDSHEPDLEKQLAFLEQYKERMTENSVVVGHSMGGFLAMHFVERLNKRIEQLICVAPVFNGLIDYVDWSDKLTGWEVGSDSMRRKYDSDKIKRNTKSWNVFLSKNDEGILYPYAQEHFDSIWVSHTDIENAWHFCERNWYAVFPQLLETISPSIAVYTTRIDTVYGMTYVVLAADHKDVESWITTEQKDACEAYIAEAKNRSDQDRTNEGKEKTGVFTGSYVVNPFNGERIPVWIGDYVLGSYGTGAVMAVPAHDERDFEFAKKMNLPIKHVVAEKFWETLPNFAPRLGVGALIIDNQWNALIQSRSSERGELYSFPWGGVEDGETSVEAISREVLEETWYTDFTVKECIGAFEYNYFSPEWWKNRKLTESTYLIALNSEKRQEMELTEKEQSLNIQNFWMKPEEALKKLTTPQDYCGFPEEALLQRYINGQSFCWDGVLFDSAEFSGLTSAEAREKLAEKAEREGFGKKKTNYKLRDWLFSRQRYWGEPIPLIHIGNEDYEKLSVIYDSYYNEWAEQSFVNTHWMTSYILSETTGYMPTAVGEAFVYTIDNMYDESIVSYIAIVDSIQDKSFSYTILSKIHDGLYGKIICDYNLPLELPEVTNYEPAGDGNSPLALVPEFVNVRIADNLTGKRETNTMPQWAGSCWYYLRFMDPTNDQYLVDPKLAEYWGQVDSYVGGAEHAVLHLLYARFWHKFLFDIGVVPNKEPFQSLHNQGMILAYAYERENGGLVASDCVEERDGKFYETVTGKEVKKIVAKMSKSLKNVVNPDAVIEEYGTDTFRLYEMYMSDFKDSAPWNTEAIVGVRRFLERAHTIFETPRFASDDMKAMKLLHKTIKKVGEDIEAFKFNTAISALMILLNEGLPKDEESQTEWKETFAILLHPFAPHLAEELYYMLHKGSHRKTEDFTEENSPSNRRGADEGGGVVSVFNAPWPEYQDFMLVDDEVTIAVQINGKLRGTFTFLNGVAQEEVSSRVMEDPNITKWLEGMTIVREIFVPNKLYGIVAKE